MVGNSWVKTPRGPTLRELQGQAEPAVNNAIPARVRLLGAAAGDAGRSLTVYSHVELLC